MIKASQILISLNEIYLARIKGFDVIDHEVFVNPSKRELQDLGTEVRFSADNTTKKIYAWGVNENIHKFVRRALDISCRQPIGRSYCSTILEGVAYKSGAIYKMYETDAPFMDMIDLKHKYDETWFTIDWSWADKYILVTPWIERIKEMYSKG